MSVKFSSDPSAHSNKPHANEIAYGWEEKHKVLKPKIDKLSFTYDIPSEQISTVTGSLVALAEEAGGPWKKLNSTKTYSLRRRLHHKETGENILIEAAPQPPNGKKAPLSFLRLDFNPSKLGPKGVEFLRDQLFMVLAIDHPWGKIASECTVTRMDLAVDLLGIKAEDLLVGDYTPGSAKGKPLKRMLVFSATGGLESLYLGVKPTKVRIYNKAQELIDYKQPSAFGSTAYTRIEMITEPKKPMTKLKAMVNPFLKLSIHNLGAPANPPEGLHNWNYFLDSCRVRGLDAALALLPTEELRQAYRQAIKVDDKDVWKPKMLWKKMPYVLNKSGLLADD